MSISTVNELFYRVVERNSPRVMLHRSKIRWLPISSWDLYCNVVSIARALEEWGIKPGDRVAILSENRPGWQTSEFATLLIGGIVVPIYPTLTPEQTSYLLRDSGARAIFVSTAEQYRKIVAIREQTALEKIVVMDPIGVAGVTQIASLIQERPAARDAAFDARALAAKPDDVATIIYTSGTTGTPKGAMLTHGNLASNVVYSLRDFPVGNDDVALSFLPLSHITARHVDYVMLYHGVTVAYCPFIEDLPRALRQVRPTILVSVPRVLEKIQKQVQLQTKAGWKHAVYKWSLRVGRWHRRDILRGKWPVSLPWRVADRLVFSKVRKALGGRVQIFISGGAPLGRDLAAWYADIGIRIFEGYGLTETSPVIAVNKPHAHKLGTVGRPLENLEVRIADDGEIMVRGPSVFVGYWQLPQETAAALEPDGWFHTGDVGNIDEDGFLSVTDRKKDLLKTSGGKFIAPQPIEQKLKNNPYVAEAIVIGDKRKFPSVVIAPNFVQLESWAAENGVAYGSREQLLRDERVRTLFESVMAETNMGLARFEKLKKFILVADEFSVADGSLTPTMKLKRRVIEDRYRRQIQQLYAEPVDAVEAGA
jgi:long-chain acyl-CoA synthetase